MKNNIDNTREHAHWELDLDGVDWDIPAWVCSKCGFRNSFIPVKIDLGNGMMLTVEDPTVYAGTRYCPNCGARMDESMPEKEFKNPKKYQIFAAWDCPIAISNGFTECTNRIIRENNTRGRGYSFDVLRGRTLYRKSNLTSIITSGMAKLGPPIPEEGPTFHFEGSNEDDEDSDEDEYEPFPAVDPDTGEPFT